MIRKVSVCYLIATVITIIIILIEVGFRSGVVSPFILIDTNQESSNQKLLIGKSSFQGDYLLTRFNSSAEKGQSNIDFELGDKVVSFEKISSDNNITTINADRLINNQVEVLVRNGFEGEFIGNIESTMTTKNLLFKKYNISLNGVMDTFTVKTKFRYSLVQVFIITFLSIISSAILYFILNLSEGMKNLATLFIPFILAVILPLCLNYLFLMGLVLDYTDSYLISIILSILIPVFLSLILTVYAFNATTKETSYNYYGEKKKDELSDTFLLNGREQLNIFIIATFALCYTGSYLLVPLSIQSKVMNNLFLFCLWYFVLLIVFVIGYLLLQKLTSSYKVLDEDIFGTLIKDIYIKTGRNIRINLLKGSKDEVNAWVYTFRNPFSKKVDIYVTEGLLEQFNQNELRTIIFHEMGHIKLKHNNYIILLTLLITLIMGIIMYYTRLIMLSNGWWGYILIFPLGIITLALLTEWLPKKISRLFEIQADNFAISLTENKNVYIETLIKLSKLSEDETFDDNIRREWRNTHPSFQKRIENLIEK